MADRAYRYWKVKTGSNTFSIRESVATGLIDAAPPIAEVAKGTPWETYKQKLIESKAQFTLVSEGEYHK